jgi:uncharacterized membrane protein
MNPDPHLNELKLQIERLSDELKDCRNEIEFLKNDIDQLKNRFRLATTSRPTKQSAPGFVALENFIGLKLIHFVGIIVLIVGLTIGVKYAIDIKLISTLLRILIAYLAGGALFFISLRLRKKYELFSMVLFSGAMASIYFTTYAAFAYYEMLPRSMAFVLMLLFTIFTVFNSLKYNKQEIAILGLVGAYGIPFFVRGNTENLWGLFSYIFLINAGILFLSFKKYWLSLTYLSFITTWIIVLACLHLFPEATYLVPKLAFSLLFFGLFIFSSLGFKLYKRAELNYSDTVIIIANTFCLYYSLITLFPGKNLSFVKEITVLFAFIYLAVGMISKTYLPRQKNLHSTVFSISLLGFIIFFALLYSALTITIVWGVLAILYFITGVWFKLKVFRVASIVLFGGTLFKLIIVDSTHFSPLEKIIAYIFTGIILLIVSFLYQKFKSRIFNMDDVTDNTL